jgi:hypothetical protein
MQDAVKIAYSILSALETPRSHRRTASRSGGPIRQDLDTTTRAAEVEFACMPPARRLLRDNAVLVAAFALPLVVVGFFLLATVIPRWVVPPPAHDLLLRSNRTYDGSRIAISVEFQVRDGRVEATVRPVTANTYSSLPALWLFDHKTMTIRQVPLDLPDQMSEGEAPRTIVVGALAGRRVVAQSQAPDGYEIRTRESSGGSGLIGDIFGMRRYETRVSLVCRGRVIRVPVPPPAEYQTPMYAVGWVVDEGR